VLPAPSPQPAPPAPAPQPAPPQPAPQPPAPTSVEDKAAAFIGAFDGGSCFLVRPVAGGDPNALEAIGADRAIFQRFDAGYTLSVGVEARLSARLIAAAECPALALVKLAANDANAPPRVELATYEVGRGKPLAGKISNLAGRRATLIVVDNDGVAHRLDTKPLPGGDAVAFSVPMVADASSIGPLQTVIAIASSKPLPSLDGLRAAPSADLVPRVLNEIGGAQGAVDAQFFKLGN
jgi:hypothetical protein